MNKNTASALLAGVASLLIAAQALAAEPVVLRVIEIETADVPAYLHELATLTALEKKVGSSAKTRVWKARFAGSNAGSVVVSVEYPSLTALAKDDEALRTNAELAAQMKRIGAIRMIVADSIFEEQTP
jgi:hypothetical protein